VTELVSTATVSGICVALAHYAFLKIRIRISLFFFFFSQGEKEAVVWRYAYALGHGLWLQGVAMRETLFYGFFLRGSYFGLSSARDIYFQKFIFGYSGLF
jgi:hypothetical protein